MSTNLMDLKTEDKLVLKELYYDNFGKILNFVQKNSGNQVDAEDLFQDAMMVLVEKLRQDNFQLTASIDTYVFAICKNLWSKKLRDKKLELSIEEIQSFEFLASIDKSIEKEKTYKEKLKGYLLKITAHCSRLINDIFFKEKSIEQIQKEYGYSTRHNAQNQKYKCLQQLRKIKEKEEKNKKDSWVG